MSKHRRAFFDPDYRTRPWNNSKYAPRFSGRSNAITVRATQAGAGCGCLILIGVMFMVPAIETVAGQDTADFMGGAGVMAAIFTWAVGSAWFAKRIKQRELRRLEQESQGQTVTNRPLEFQRPQPEAPLPQSDLNYAPKYIYDMPNLDRKNHVELANDFEREVAEVINMGHAYKAVVIGGAGDRGVDLQLLVGRDMVGIVQCKRYKGLVPPNDIRAFATVMRQQQVRVGYFFTTGRFSDATRREAAELGIKLVDGDEYERMKQRARAAIRRRRVR